MRTCTVIPLVILLFVSCAEKEPGHSLPLFRSELNLDTLFADFSGSFLLWRIGSDTIQVYNDVLNHIRSGPASTFKIPHALIALQTGVISPDDNIKKWDGEKKAISSWEADHSLQSAMEHSVVWYFQETARDIGEDRMREYHTERS
jgi:beta-lactamase class D